MCVCVCVCQRKERVTTDGKSEGCCLSFFFFFNHFAPILPSVGSTAFQEAVKPASTTLSLEEKLK